MVLCLPNVIYFCPIFHDIHVPHNIFVIYILYQTFCFIYNSTPFYTICFLTLSAGTTLPCSLVLLNISFDSLKHWYLSTSCNFNVSLLIQSPQNVELETTKNAKQMTIAANISLGKASLHSHSNPVEEKADGRRSTCSGQKNGYACFPISWSISHYPCSRISF